MGAVADLLKTLGFWMPEKGTVFGGEAGDGVLGKIVFVSILPAEPRPQPPVAHGHYPLRIEGYSPMGYARASENNSYQA